MCRVDDRDPNRLDSTTFVTARRTHRCYECGRDILPGEPMRRDFIINADGDARHYKICSHCDVLMDWLGENCHGWIYGDVVEDVLEHARGYLRPDLARLGVLANRQWKRLRPRAGQAPGRPVPPLPRALERSDLR